MFFEVSSLTYHSPITIELLTYRVVPGTLACSSSTRMDDVSTRVPGIEDWDSRPQDGARHESDVEVIHVATAAPQACQMRAGP